jgi:Protein of unknown function (DUF3558)
VSILSRHLKGRYRGRAVAAAVVLLLPGLAACSSTPSRPSAAGSPSGSASATSTPAPSLSAGSDLCTVVPSANVTAAFGGSVTTATAVAFLGNPSCTYAVKGSNLGADGGIQVADMVIWKARNYQVAKQTGLTGGDVDVTGVGDDAYYDPTTTGLVFHKGDTVYFVLAQFKAAVGVVLDAAKMKADVVALAKSVAGRL